MTKLMHNCNSKYNSLIKDLKILKHIECCNFQIIAEMYIKVYISGMEMSQRIRFWYQILLKMMIFWENGKKTLFWSKILWQANKNSFELKMPKFLGNLVKTHV